MAAALTELHEVVAGGGEAGGGDRHAGAALLERVEELAEVLERRVRVGGDGRQVGHREEHVPVLEAAIEQAQHAVGADVGRRARRPGVAVLGRLDGVLGADGARGAGLIDDDELLLELGLELGGDDAGHLVGRAAGRPRHDDRHGTIGLPGIVLGEGRGGQQAHRTADERRQNAFHFASSHWAALRNTR